MDRHATPPTGFHFQHHNQNACVTAATLATAAADPAEHEGKAVGEWEREVLLLAMATRSSAPPLLRRSSSADIPIPQFMIPSSAHQLMNKRYALASSS